MSKFIDTMVNAIGEAIKWFYGSEWYMQLLVVILLLFIAFRVIGKMITWFH